MFLFVIASLLLVAQTIANFIHRARRTKHGTDRTMTAAGARKTDRGERYELRNHASDPSDHRGTSEFETLSN
jgi:hypothetical protein